MTFELISEALPTVWVGSPEYSRSVDAVMAEVLQMHKAGAKVEHSQNVILIGFIFLVIWSSI